MLYEEAFKIKQREKAKGNKAEIKHSPNPLCEGGSYFVVINGKDIIIRTSDYAEREAA